MCLCIGNIDDGEHCGLLYERCGLLYDHCAASYDHCAVPRLMQVAKTTSEAAEALYAKINRNTKKGTAVDTAQAQTQAQSRSPDNSASRPRLPRPQSLAAAAAAMNGGQQEATLSSAATTASTASTAKTSTSSPATSFSFPTISTTQLLQDNRMQALVSASDGGGNTNDDARDGPRVGQSARHNSNTNTTSSTPTGIGGASNNAAGADHGNAVYALLDSERDSMVDTSNVRYTVGDLGGAGYLGVGTDGGVVYDSIAGAHGDDDDGLDGDEADDAVRGSYASIASVYEGGGGVARDGGGGGGGRLRDLPVALMAATAKQGGARRGGYDNAEANPRGNSGLLLNAEWYGSNDGGEANSNIRRNDGANGTGARGVGGSAKEGRDPFVLESDTLPTEEPQHGCCTVL